MPSSIDSELDALLRRLAASQVATISEDEWQAEQARRRQEEASAANRERRTSVIDQLEGRIPSHMQRLIREGAFEDTSAVKAVRAWLQSERPTPILVLVGGAGSGKTVAGICALCMSGGAFVRASDLAKRMDPWGQDREQHQPLDIRHRLIVLDDLGTERERDERFLSCLDEFVDARQGTYRGRQLLTLITTNVPAKSLRTRYGDRVADRLSGSGTAVALTDESMRGGRR